MKKSKIKLLQPPTPTSPPPSTQLLSPTSRVGNDYLNFWSELKRKPKPKAKQVAVQTLDETSISQKPQTTPQPQPRPFVPKSHSLTDYDGINEFFQVIKTPQKSNPLLFFLFIMLLIL
jgi:hypothetical protein